MRVTEAFNRYETAIQRDDCEAIYVTEIDGDYECDTFFPPIPKYFRLISETKIGSDLTFKKYENWTNRLSEEVKYGENSVSPKETLLTG